MINLAKLAAITALNGIFLVGSLAPANAFRLQEPAGTPGGGAQQAASAFVEDSRDAAAGEASALSPAEIRHVSWCAARYGLAYDAVNDMYEGNGGTRSRCLSPQ